MRANEIEKRIKKLLEREERAKKKKYAPKGATVGAQVQRTKESQFYLHSKRKPEIKVIDKTKK